MKSYNCFLILCLLPTVAAAENLTVVKSNFVADLAYIDQDAGDAHFQIITASLPVSAYIGVRVSAGLNQFDANGEALDSDGWKTGGEFFLGSYALGRFGFSYVTSESEYDSDIPDFKVDTDIRGLFAEYYLGDFTFGYARYSADSTVSVPGDLSAERFSYERGTRHGMLTAVWYGNEEIKLDLSAGSDDRRDTYAAGVHYLPDFWGRKASLSLTATEYPQRSLNTDDYYLSLLFRYYFTDAASFIDRDRMY